MSFSIIGGILCLCRSVNYVLFELSPSFRTVTCHSVSWRRKIQMSVESGGCRGLISKTLSTAEVTFKRQAGDLNVEKKRQGQRVVRALWRAMHADVEEPCCEHVVWQFVW